MSLRTLRLCVIIFLEGGLQANWAAKIGFGAKHCMRIGCKELLILRFSHDSVSLTVAKPRGTYVPSASYLVSTHGKP